MQTITRELREQLAKLEAAVQNEDWEVVHAVYDDIVFAIARRNAPRFMEMLDKMVEKASFWYA